MGPGPLGPGRSRVVLMLSRGIYISLIFTHSNFFLNGLNNIVHPILGGRVLRPPPPPPPGSATYWSHCKDE